MKMRTPPDNSQGFYSQDEIDDMDLDTARYEVFRLQCILAQKEWEEQQRFEVHLFERFDSIIQEYIHTDLSNYDALFKTIELFTECRLKYWEIQGV